MLPNGRLLCGKKKRKEIMENKEEVYDVAKEVVAQRQQAWVDEVKALVPALRRQGVTEAAITDLVETVDKVNPNFLQHGMPRQPSMDDPRKEHTFTSGAESSRKAKDYGLCPTEAIEAIVDRFQYGIDVHGEKWRGNWKTGKDDPEFVRERIDHAYEHIQAILTGYHVQRKRPASYEDVEAVLCNMAMVAWWYTHGEGLCNAFPHLTSEGPHPPLSDVKR